jgi:uncharacterized membrane protein
MDTALWIVQILLAVIFLLAGVMQLIVPREKAMERQPYCEDYTQRQLHLIGVVEILGALGLILPAVTGILTWLIPLAAVGLAITMVVAARVHYRRQEYPNIISNVILLLLSLFVAYGRFFVEPL